MDKQTKRDSLISDLKGELMQDIFEKGILGIIETNWKELHPVLKLHVTNHIEKRIEAVIDIAMDMNTDKFKVSI